MATVNQSSLRAEFDALKARFESLCAEGKMSADSRALFDALLMLFEVLMAVFMEKHTPKSSANSSLPASQSPNDNTARTRPGAKGKGPSHNDARCANTRTRESIRTVTTKAVHELLTGVEPPVLVDVLGGKGRRTVPGAIWLKGAGRSTDREEDIDDRLGAKLDEITEGDKARSIVFFCLSAKCWLSHNAALRAIALGYENVHWYRGGIKAWKKARLPTEKARKTTW